MGHVDLCVYYTRFHVKDFMSTTQFPENDDQFEEFQVTEAIPQENGFVQIHFKDVWITHLETTLPVKAGDTLRLYGRGIGYPPRGAFINGEKVFYRTEEEDEVHQLKVRYGASAEEWLQRWDADEIVWTVEMGGLGPGYEQVIHILAAEILRYFLEKKPDADGMSDEESVAFFKELDKWSFELRHVKQLHPSGAQFDAARNLAIRLYCKGPVEVFTDLAIQDRLIMVSKHFPDVKDE